MSHLNQTTTLDPVASPPRTVLICHHDEPFNREGLSRWLAAKMSLTGIIVLTEPPGRLRQRVRREVRRVGWLRFLDVIAFRVFQKLFLAKSIRESEHELLARIAERFPPVPASVPELHTSSPNGPDVEAFLRDLQPDLMIARCKTLLKPSIFSIPRDGTFVLHPGICPEYRNAHGCFWALANRDFDRVGLTLLKVDCGVDTGPVYAHFPCRFDQPIPSHLTLQDQVVFDHLDAIADKLREIHADQTQPIATTGRESHEWGQPWLSAYPRFRSAMRQLQGTSSKFRSPVPRISISHPTTR